MYFYVYVIYSDQKNLFYKGSTSDIEKRMFEHNNDLGRYTAGKGPWKLVVLERYDSKREANNCACWEEYSNLSNQCTISILPVT